MMRVTIPTLNARKYIGWLIPSLKEQSIFGGDDVFMQCVDFLSA